MTSFLSLAATSDCWAMRERASGPIADHADRVKEEKPPARPAQHRVVDSFFVYSVCVIGSVAPPLRPDVRLGETPTSPAGAHPSQRQTAHISWGRNAHLRVGDDMPQFLQPKQTAQATAIEQAPGRVRRARGSTSPPLGPTRRCILAPRPSPSLAPRHDAPRRRLPSSCAKFDDGGDADGFQIESRADAPVQLPPPIALGRQSVVK